MFVETMIACGAAYYLLKQDEFPIRKKWKQIMQAGGNYFKNGLGKTLKILEIENKDYGYDIKIEFPLGYTFEDFEKDLSIFKEAYGLKTIETENWDNICIMRCMEVRPLKVFRIVPLPPNRILIADGLDGPIHVDMCCFPHLLVGGDTGTGKSRVLFCILTNLIATTNRADIYLMQVRKSDLEVFKDCKQVKTLAKTLLEVRDTLIKLDQECIRREPLINPLEGIYNLEDYNRKNPDKKLNYIYGVIEEFSFLNIDKGDSKIDKKIKEECLRILKHLVNVGRAAGMFLIISIQKPTNDSIPSNIKSQLTTRVSLRITDEAPAIVIMGNKLPTTLKQRQQLIVNTLDRKMGYSYTINHDLIIENIRSSIIDKPKPEPKKPKKPIEVALKELVSKVETD